MYVFEILTLFMSEALLKSMTSLCQSSVSSPKEENKAEAPMAKAVISSAQVVPPEASELTTCTPEAQLSTTAPASEQVRAVFSSTIIH